MAIPQETYKWEFESGARLDETHTGTTGSVANGTLSYTASPIRASGFGDAVDLDDGDSINTNVVGGPSGNLNNAGSLTFSAVFEADARVSAKVIAIRGSNHFLDWDGNGDIRAQFQTVDGSSNTNATLLRLGTDSLVTGRMYHIVSVIDINALTVQLYVNGILADEASLPGDTVSLRDSVGTEYYIGQAQFSTPHTDGRIDDVRVWESVDSSAALTASEVKELWETYRGSLPNRGTDIFSKPPHALFLRRRGETSSTFLSRVQNNIIPQLPSWIGIVLVDSDATWDPAASENSAEPRWDGSKPLYQYRDKTNAIAVKDAFQSAGFTTLLYMNGLRWWDEYDEQSSSANRDDRTKDWLNFIANTVEPDGWDGIYFDGQGGANYSPGDGLNPSSDSLVSLNATMLELRDQWPSGVFFNHSSGTEDVQDYQILADCCLFGEWDGASDNWTDVSRSKVSSFASTLKDNKSWPFYKRNSGWADSSGPFTLSQFDEFKFLPQIGGAGRGSDNDIEKGLIAQAEKQNAESGQLLL